jgi:glutamine synthetase
MADLLAYLQEADIEVEQWSEEYGPGQVEVNLRYGQALPAADAVTIFKLAFRSLARRHGLLGTFMPKPFGDQAGSGMHVHLSASPRAGTARDRQAGGGPGENLFDDPADTELGLSTLGRRALAGLLAHGAALTALGASTVNSYKRFLPGSWAPTHVMYAYASRAAFIRIPERETPRRLELRAGDAAGTAYIYLAGILAAMLDGIERRLDPGPAVPGDVGAMAAEAEQRGIRPLPRTLEAALQALEADEVIRTALGDIILDEYIKVKRSEWEAFALHVGAWDRDWYLRRY